MGEPVLNALLLIDNILTEDNGKKILIGIFNRFSFPSFPAQAPAWFIYASVDNLEGHNTFTFRLTLSETGEVAFSVGGEIQINDASSGVELALPVPPIVFRRAGKYILEFLTNGSVLTSRIIQVAPMGTEVAK